MKAILEFNLDDLEDKESHLRCVKSLDMYLCILDIQQTLRNDGMSITEIKDVIHETINYRCPDFEEFGS